MANIARMSHLLPTESPPFRGIVSRTVAGWLRAFHDIVTPTLCTNQSSDGEVLTNEGRGRSCQLVMVKVTELRLCPVHQSRLASLAAAACFERDPHCSTVLCTVYTCTVYCAVITVTSQLVPGYRWPATLTQADFTKVRKLSFFRHIG